MMRMVLAVVVAMEMATAAMVLELAMMMAMAMAMAMTTIMAIVGDDDGVAVGDEDDGALVGDGVLVGDGGEGAPLLEVEDGVGIGDESVALGVGRGAHEDPAEHGVTAVPLLGLDGGTPAVLGEGGVLLLPVLDALAEDVVGEHGGVEVEAGGAVHVA